MVCRIAAALKRRLPWGVAFEDLLSSGVLGLVDARRRFDPGRGVAFGAFARRRILGAMWDGLRATDPVPRLVRSRIARVNKLHADLEARCGGAVPLEAAIAAARISPEGAVLVRRALAGTRSLDRGADERTGFSAEAVDRRRGPAADAGGADLQAFARRLLTGREWHVVRRVVLEEESMREVGIGLGLSESRICQIYRGALERLRRRVEKPS